MKRAGAQPLLAALTALTVWITLYPWRGLAAEPGDMLAQLLVGVVVIGGVGVLLRWASLGWPFVASGQLLAAMLVVHGYWGTSAWPRPRSLQAAVEAVARAVHTAGEFHAPVPDTAPSIVPLLLVTGLAVALVGDLVAVSLGRVGLSGLVLLTAYTVPVSVLGYGSSVLNFLGAGAGFLGMLAADERGRLERWGRQVGRSGRPGHGGALVGSGSLLVAVLVAAVLPSGTTFSLPGIGNGRGNGPVRITDPIADLRRDLVLGADIPLLRVRVSDDKAPSYVRLTVLDSFDGETWRPGDHPRPAGNTAEGDVPIPGFSPGHPGTDAVWSVTADDRFASSWLPVPRYLRSLNADTGWRYADDTADFRAARHDRTTAGLSYSLVEFRPTLSADELAAAGAAPEPIGSAYTRLPKGSSFRALAERETAGATTDYARGVALQRYFQSQFRYSTRTAAGNGIDDLRHFLGPDGHEGYCEQFAAAMAVLARELGIPARVSVGFLNSQRVGRSTYEFSSHDLHAWPELYLQGSGWVMFEPTPTSHTGAVPAYTNRSGQGPNQPSASASTATARPSTGPSRSPQRPETGGSGQVDESGPLQTWLPAGLVICLAIVLLALLPRAIRSRRRGRRFRDATPEAVWEELRDTAIDLGLPWPEGRSPRVTGRALAGALDHDHDARGALAVIVGALETDRYAPARPAEGTSLADEVEACVHALESGATAAARRRARWRPRSLRRSTPRPRAGLRQHVAPGTLDRLDDAE